ncbi:MAG: MCE family protein [Rhizobacter sp.]|nr:MCE family protein [Chlorobiales bacterium]
MKPEFKVGITVIAALIILGGSLWWGKQWNLGAERRVSILFSNVSGLQEGDPVTISGVRQGKVESIQIIARPEASKNAAPVAARNSLVNVSVSLPTDAVLYRDATARLMMLELISGKKIELSAGSPASGVLREGEVVSGKFASDIPELVGFVGEALDTLRLVIRDAQGTLQSANRIIGDAGFQEDVKLTLQNLRAATGDLAVVSRDVRQSNVKGLVAKIDRAVTSLGQIADDLKPELKGTVTDVRKTVKDADELILSIKSITEKLNTDRATLLNKLLYDEAFYLKLDGILNHLDSVLTGSSKDGVKVKVQIF